MGMFSYVCTKCGPKDQFDWMDSCVVKIVKLGHVNGQYDGYGRVQVTIQGQQEPAMVCPWQFQSYTWQSGMLLATDIYCNGNHEGDEVDVDEMFMAFMRSGKDFDSEEENDTPRFCVPKDLVVLDGLTKEQYEKAVQDSARAVARMDKKRKERHHEAKEAAKKKKESSQDEGVTGKEAKNEGGKPNASVTKSN